MIVQLGLKNSSHPNELKGDAIIKDFYLDMGSLLSPAKKKILNVSFNFFLAPLIALVTTLLLLLLRLLQFLLWL